MASYQYAAPPCFCCEHRSQSSLLGFFCAVFLTFISGDLLKVACQCGFMQPTPAELSFDRQQGEVVHEMQTKRVSLSYIASSLANFTANLLN